MVALLGDAEVERGGHGDAGADARLCDCLDGVQAFLGRRAAAFEGLAGILVGGGYGHVDLHSAVGLHDLLEEVQVAGYERGAGLDHELDLGVYIGQGFEHGAGDLGL